MMADKKHDLEDLDALLAILRKHGVGLFERGDLKIVFPGALEEAEEEREKATEVPGDGVHADTGLTKAEEEDLFYSSNGKP